MAQSQGLVNGAVYRIKNMDSGKYLNVHYGVDANGTNVYQWSYDGSTEQKFKLVYNAASDSYKLYAMCSSNGNNRVIDVARNGSPLGSGQNVGIWTPIDDTAQRLQIDFLQNNLYVIRMKANPSMFVAVNGTANGTASGKLPTSPGNVYIDTYDVWRSQEWYFELVSNSAPVNPTGWLEAVTSTEISGWAWRSDIPNNPINVSIHITNVATGVTEAIHTTIANIYRNDLVNAGVGNGYHGYNFNVNWSVFKYGTYSISVYGVGANGSTYSLSGSPKQYTVTNTIGYKGYAVYRDLGFWANIGSNAMLEPNEWHAGLMDECYASDIRSVIHVPGLSGNVEWIDWVDFIGELDYNGTYRPKQNLSDYDRMLFITLARELQTKDIGYIGTHQLQATIFPNATKIQPEDIVSIRCDGLVEYCYEYYGYRVFGDDNYWDITVANQVNLAHHIHKNIMPKKQTQQYLELVTYNVPN